MHRLVRLTLRARPLRPITYPLLRRKIKRRGRSQIAIVIDGKAWSGDVKDIPGWEEFERGEEREGR